MAAIPPEIPQRSPVLPDLLQPVPTSRTCILGNILDCRAGRSRKGLYPFSLSSPFHDALQKIGFTWGWSRQAGSTRRIHPLEPVPSRSAGKNSARCQTSFSTTCILPPSWMRFERHVLPNTTITGSNPLAIAARTTLFKIVVSFQGSSCFGDLEPAGASCCQDDPRDLFIHSPRNCCPPGFSLPKPRKPFLDVTEIR